MTKAAKLKQPQFPNIFRIITENKRYKSILGSKKAFYILSGLMFFVSVVLAAQTMIAAASLYRNANALVKLTDNRFKLKSKVNFWTSISDEYEGYKDAYFQIATLEYKLGDMDKAKQADLNALLLDPNFEDAKKLEVLLENRLN